MGIKGYSIQEIPSPIVDDFLKRHHYLSQQGHGFLSLVNYGLFTSSGSMAGVVTFSGLSVVETVIGAFEGIDRQSSQKGFYELSRLSMDDELKEKNLTSWFVSRCLKLLRRDHYVRAVISYADSRYHHGYIYQATNFKYYGMTAPKTDFYIKTLDGKERQVWRGKVKDMDGEWKARARKHRYMIVYDKTLTVKWKEQQYPKGDNNVFKLEKPKIYQINMFDYAKRG